ncbi:MAG: (deoxy)nucleoside triphosphate pyrophosphohydrolase [Firmicutes bacterium]|nr:(deoxy)nucleoside triphosphate pyrophosphohydrolase [Bacillota bacterium]
MLIVTAGIIKNNDKILISQREFNKNQGLKWEFPGGKLKGNEKPEDGLKREILEELNINIEVLDIFHVIYHRYNDFDILLLCYTAEFINGNIMAKECKDYRWVSTNELHNFQFSQADIGIIKKILTKGIN